MGSNAFPGKKEEKFLKETLQRLEEIEKRWLKDRVDKELTLELMKAVYTLSVILKRSHIISRRGERGVRNSTKKEIHGEV